MWQGQVVTYVFVDESGDLNFDFRYGTSFFLVAAIYTNNRRPIEKVIRSVHRQIRKKYRLHSVLHAVEQETTTVERLCRKLANTSVRAAVAYIDKRTLVRRSTDPRILYAEAVVSLLRMVLQDRSITMPVDCIVEQRETSRYLNDLLISYIQRNLQGNLDVTVRFQPPQAARGLQAADAVAWSLFRYLERGDDRCYRHLQPLLVHKLRLPD